MEKTKWWRFVESIIGDDTLKQAATKADFNQSAFTRWKNGARADPDFVVKFARAYEINVLSALVAAEFITEKEASLTEVSPPIDLAKIPGPELMGELERRIEGFYYLDNLSRHPQSEISAWRSNRITPDDRTDEDDVIADANKLRGAAQKRTPRLDEPDNP